MKKLVNLILICMLAYPLTGIVTSCAEESDCSVAGRAMIWCELKKVENALALNDTLDSLTVTAFGTDSILLNNEKKVSSIRLPLQYTVDSTAFVFHYTRFLRDTIIIRHKNTPYFLSMECGYDVVQSITSKPEFTEHELDSIKVISTNTNTNGTKNLTLYYPG